MTLNPVSVAALSCVAAKQDLPVADAATLRELDRLDGPALQSLAARFGSTRLFDYEPLP